MSKLNARTRSAVRYYANGEATKAVILASMRKPFSLGIFAEAGGNKVFFVNGALGALRKAGIRADKIVGFSSSSPIVLAYLAGGSDAAVTLFAKKLDANEKNFYFFRKEHLPHNEIYESSVGELLRDFGASSGEFLILATESSSRWVKTVAFLSTAVLVLKFSSGINLVPALRKLFRMRRIELRREDFSYATALPFIMGSSTLFPFIRPHVINGSLILEGALLEPDYKNELRDCERKIVIHTAQGKTGAQGDTFHIYSKDALPNNVLDYTDGSKIRTYHKMGEEEVQGNLVALQAFLGRGCPAPAAEVVSYASSLSSFNG